MWPFSQKTTGMHRLGSAEVFGGWIPEHPSIKDYKFGASAMASTIIPQGESTDRRALMLNAPVIDQGDLGSCVGCSSAYAVAFLRRSDKDRLSTLYSALFQYYEARLADGPQWRDVDSGAYIRDSMDRLRKVGIPPATRWPYNVKKFAKTPPKSAYEEAKRWRLGAHWKCESLEDILKAIASGCAVVGGISLYSSSQTPEVGRTGRIPDPKQSDKLLGGHALYFDRYSYPDRAVRFQNSWGPTWGDGGYGYVSFGYLSNPDLADDFWAMSAEAPETTPWKD